MSAFEGKADNICSFYGFALLTRSGHLPEPERLSQTRLTVFQEQVSKCFQFAFVAATRCPGTPARSMACCTNPEALACSINSLM